DNSNWPVDVVETPPGAKTDSFANFRFGSAHASGFNMAFCDGSVHTILYEIDQTLYAFLSNRMDGNTIDSTLLSLYTQ
ncbi:MAG TPA: DUF1559 domain-containing protein, partial [Pirellulales bacterium]|nr:DUF1559 domain-containing protein [Pirellulales bacterium]